MSTLNLGLQDLSYDTLSDAKFTYGDDAVVKISGEDQLLSSSVTHYCSAYESVEGSSLSCIPTLQFTSSFLWNDLVVPVSENILAPLGSFLIDRSVAISYIPYARLSGVYVYPHKHRNADGSRWIENTEGRIRYDQLLSASVQLLGPFFMLAEFGYLGVRINRDETNPRSQPKMQIIAHTPPFSETIYKLGGEFRLFGDKETSLVESDWVTAAFGIHWSFTIGTPNVEIDAIKAINEDTGNSFNVSDVVDVNQYFNSIRHHYKERYHFLRLGLRNSIGEIFVEGGPSLLDTGLTWEYTKEGAEIIKALNADPQHPLVKKNLDENDWAGRYGFGISLNALKATFGIWDWFGGTAPTHFPLIVRVFTQWGYVWVPERWTKKWPFAHGTKFEGEYTNWGFSFEGNLADLGDLL